MLAFCIKRSDRTLKRFGYLDSMREFTSGCNFNTFLERKNSPWFWKYLQLSQFAVAALFRWMRFLVRRHQRGYCARFRDRWCCHEACHSSSCGEVVIGCESVELFVVRIYGVWRVSDERLAANDRLPFAVFIWEWDLVLYQQSGKDGVKSEAKFEPCRGDGTDVPVLKSLHRIFMAREAWRWRHF